MSLAVREVSVAKGYDPRDFALVASGGAGPLHVCAIARELYIPTVIVPLFPSHFSALGMLLADERHDFIRTVYCRSRRRRFRRLVKIHDEMVTEAKAGLRHGKDAQYQVNLDIRYVGQEFTLPVPVTLEQLKRGDRAGIRTAFDKLYEHRYAHHSPEEPVEMVNVRLGAIGKRPKLAFPSLGASAAAEPAGRAPGLFLVGEQAASPRRSIAARHSARARDRRAGADPGARHHDGAVRARSLQGRAVRRTDRDDWRRGMNACDDGRLLTMVRPLPRLRGRVREGAPPQVPDADCSPLPTPPPQAGEGAERYAR